MKKLLKFLNKDTYNTFDAILLITLGQFIVTKSDSFMFISIVSVVIIVTVIRALINRIK